MIEGVVNAACEPVVVLTVHGPSGQATEIEAIIDTGFTGFLTVTPALAAELELSLEGASRATLAGGSEVTFVLYDVAVLWDGQPKYVLAGAADTTPLMGMRMLDRHNLNIDVEDAGRDVIQAKE